MLNVDSDFILVISALFSSAWKIATSFHVPGTNLNIPEFVFACMMVVFVVKAVPKLLGFASIFESGPDGNPGRSQNSSDGNDRGVGRW